MFVELRSGNGLNAWEMKDLDENRKYDADMGYESFGGSLCWLQIFRWISLRDYLGSSRDDAIFEGVRSSAVLCCAVHAACLTQCQRGCIERGVKGRKRTPASDWLRLRFRFRPPTFYTSPPTSLHCLPLFLTAGSPPPFRVDSHSHVQTTGSLARGARPAICQRGHTKALAPPSRAGKHVNAHERRYRPLRECHCHEASSTRCRKHQVTDGLERRQHWRAVRLPAPRETS